MGGLIEYIFPGSQADRLGIKAGDILCSINGHELNDLIDYNYYAADEELQLRIKKSDGSIKEFNIRHNPDRELGIQFNANVFDGIRSCRNNCLFCFVSQLPKGCRRSMYLKDDDYRMSFMEGSYITATNMSEDDFDRIAKLRLSPLYISIHTTDPELRCKLLRNPKAGGIMQIMQRLVRDQISFHGQLVLCPGFNDGEELRRTIEDLLSLRPNLLSLALVPVGLTAFQENASMRLYTKEEAIAVICLANEFQKQLAEDNFIYIADEFYLIAGEPFPGAEHYDDFCQLENGVGMTASFYADWDFAREDFPDTLSQPKVLNIITGVSGAQVLHKAAEDMRSIGNLQVNIFAVPNKFFGESVTVTGLVTGSDIVSAMKDWRAIQKSKPLLIIPDVMLKFDAPVFLDGMTVEELEQALDCDIKVIANGAFALADLIEEEI